MAKNIIRKNEFRIHNSKESGYHPTYIYAKKGKKFIFVGITHSDITDGIENIPLIKNPNPKDKRKAYFRSFWDSGHYTSFGKKKKGWVLHPDDKNKIPRNKKK